jgi:ASC-1-like (ASCH) protein
MVKKQVFDWIRTRQKTIELRRGRAREGDKAVFQCGRNILRGIIAKKEQGNLTDVLRQDNYKNIIPIAYCLEEAITYFKGLCGIVEGRFTTFLKPSYSLFKILL